MKTITTSYGVIKVFGNNPIVYESLVRDWIECDEVKEQYEHFLNLNKQGFINKDGKFINGYRNI